MVDQFEVFTDGGARGNPGPAAIGIVVYKNSQQVFSTGKYIGIQTNNLAEYQAINEAVEWIVENNFGNVHCVFKLDSELVVRQLNLIYKVKDEKLKVFFNNIQQLLSSFSVKPSIIHIPRSQNQAADKLVNEALDRQLQQPQING